MRYVAEQDRKFTDLGGVKIHHSIYPIVMPIADSCWGPVIKFDNKQILAGRQEVQSFIGSSVQIIRMMISGTIVYFDSTGYRAVISDHDVLSINASNEVLHSVLENPDDSEDAELVEIWLQSGESDRKYELHSGAASKDAGRLYTAIAGKENLCLSTGTFIKGHDYEIKHPPAGHSVILFVLSGSAIANNKQLAYGDTLFFFNESIRLESKTSANILMMEMDETQINQEAAK